MDKNLLVLVFSPPNKKAADSIPVKAYFVIRMSSVSNYFNLQAQLPVVVHVHVLILNPLFTKPDPLNIKYSYKLYKTRDES